MKNIERRTFLKSAAAFSAFTILKPETVFGTAANSAIRMGIIGCGERGTAVLTAMSANAYIEIIALADIFDDKLLLARKAFNRCNANNGFAEIQEARIYRGSKAYLMLLGNQDVDAVLISTPAYAHPEFLEAAVSAGKHAYCEKPAAIDIDGCKRILNLSENINNKLSVVLGFQIRYATPYMEMVKRIQQGDIGDVICAQLYYFSSGVPIKPHDRMSYDEARLRNHYHFNELSGGILLDQGIHMIDICNWALKSTPLHATGAGGRKGGLEFGNTWTNYQVIYKYPNDVNVSLQSTQVGPSFGDVCARFVGTKGIAEAHYSGGIFINGEKEWDSGVIKAGAALTPQHLAAGASLSSLDDSDKNKGTSFINSIETGHYLNQLRSGCDSTLSAILGREAATRQELVNWEEMDLASEKIDPRLNFMQFDK
jgi:myo-inositol 2-dehydrogenase/D-chiro-inositol 1-dehydrogenase